MKQVSGKELARVVERQGWQLLRVNGSHHIYGKAGSDVRLSIPVHANRPLKFGLLKNLLKQAGLTEADV
jgi:predicted RNA binding protein YcfA (HicA-like mRNA interferase family)